MKIIWSIGAKISYKKILGFLKENWTEKEIDNFVNDTKEVIFQIQQSPLMFIASGKKKKPDGADL